MQNSRGTAFIDGGCYDGNDSIRFSKMAEGDYSKIFAFEPDQTNYRLARRCLEAAGIQNVELFSSALGSVSGAAEFIESSTQGSYLVSAGQDNVGATHAIPEGETTTVPVQALDELVDIEVGMIKLDVEGAELDALHGAKRILQHDKPLLAVSIYHQRGDMLAVMDYLHEVVPEYRFWIRHHGCLSSESILYASV